MKVRAIREGQYANTRRRIGEVFVIENTPVHEADVGRYKKDDPTAFSPVWMRKVPAEEPVTPRLIKTASGVRKLKRVEEDGAPKKKRTASEDTVL